MPDTRLTDFTDDSTDTDATTSTDTEPTRTDNTADDSTDASADEKNTDDNAVTEQSCADVQETELVNIKHTDKSKYETEYIGRGKNNAHILNTDPGDNGQFGNPHPVSEVNGTCPVCDEDHSREESIERYRRDFATMIQTNDEFRRNVERLQGETLACWCKPEPCHGDVILAYLHGEFDVEEYAAKPRPWDRPRDLDSDEYWDGDRVRTLDFVGDTVTKGRWTRTGKDTERVTTTVTSDDDPVQDVAADESLAGRVHVPRDETRTRLFYHLTPPVEVGGQTVDRVNEDSDVFESLDKVFASTYLDLENNGDEVTLESVEDEATRWVTEIVDVPLAEPWWTSEDLERLVELLEMVRDVREWYSDAPSSPKKNSRGKSREWMLEDDDVRECVEAFNAYADELGDRGVITSTNSWEKLEKKHPVVGLSAKTDEDEYPRLSVRIQHGGRREDPDTGMWVSIEHCSDDRCACASGREKVVEFDEFLEPCPGNGSDALGLGVDVEWLRRRLSRQERLDD